MGRHPAEPFFWAAAAFTGAFLIVFFAVRSQWINEHDKLVIPASIPQTHQRHAAVVPAVGGSKSSVVAIANSPAGLVPINSACLQQVGQEKDTRCFAGYLFRVSLTNGTPKYEQVVCAGRQITCTGPDQSLKP